MTANKGTRKRGLHRRDKRRPVLNHDHVARYIANIKQARARRSDTWQELLAELSATVDRLGSAEARLVEIAALLEQLPSIGRRVVVTWRSAADLQYPVKPRGPYWLTQLRGGPAVQIGAAGVGTRRPRPGAKHLRECYGSLASTAAGYVAEYMRIAAAYEQEGALLARVFMCCKVDARRPDESDLFAAAKQYRENGIREIAGDFAERVARMARLDEDLDEVMLEFNTTAPTGFGTYAVHWVVKENRRTIYGPGGPEFRVCLNYRPATGVALWRPLKAFVIKRAPSQPEVNGSAATPKEAGGSMESEVDARPVDAVTTKSGDSASSEPQEKGGQKATKRRPPKASEYLTHEHIKAGRLGKYGRQLLALSRRIRDLKQQREEAAAVPLAVYNIIRKRL